MTLVISAPKKENRGCDVEDVVERLCRVALLTDFVVRSPKYRKKSGHIKEAADFLVPFGDILLAFQVGVRPSESCYLGSSRKASLMIRLCNSKALRGLRGSCIRVISWAKSRVTCMTKECGWSDSRSNRGWSALR